MGKQKIRRESPPGTFYQRFRCGKQNLCNLHHNIDLLTLKCQHFIGFCEIMDLFIDKASYIGIRRTASQKKSEKLYWECIFALSNLKRKPIIEGQHAYYFSYIGDSRCYILYYVLCILKTFETAIEFFSL